MKTGRLFSVLMGALAVLTMGIAGEAIAGWSYMQGSAAEVQHPDRTNWTRIATLGLDLDLKHGQSTWVYIPIQTPILTDANPSAKADKIRLFIYTGSDLKVTAVHIYNAAWKVQEIVGDIQQISPYYFWQEIAIDSAYGFSFGFGISLQITAGTNSSLDHRFCLATAGVHWISGNYVLDAAATAVGDSLQVLQDRPEAEPVSPPPPPRKTGER